MLPQVVKMWRDQEGHSAHSFYMLEFPQGLMHSSENESERTREAQAHCPAPERNLSTESSCDVVAALPFYWAGK